VAGKTCPSCTTENPPQARFCLACGTQLALTCAACGESLPPEAKFCMSCGTPVAGAPVAARAAPSAPTGPPTPYPTPESPPEERRQVTVLFADLSGYTAVSERLDPEQVKRLVDRSLSRLQEEVDRYGGRVDKFMGDNVMALFGAPVAHEDDPQRAVRAGLGMQAAMAEINERIERDHGVSLSLRVGINSGEVLAGAVGASYTVTGDVVNVASRLQSAAEPGTVVVGERTYRATNDVVEFRSLPPLALKGKAEPVPAWQAIGVAAEAAVRRAARVESPLVGRDAELSLLLDVQARTVRERRAHLMTVVGQAGVGKSRLLREFQSALGQVESAPAFRQGRCPPYGAGVVYWAFGEILRQECGIVEGDPSDVAWEKLSARLDDVLRETGEAEEGRVRKLALVGRVLGIEPQDVRDQADEDPRRAREAFFSAVRSCVEGMALERPLVLAFEDIHWADGGMLDLIEHVARFVRAPVLVLCLTRHELLERRAEWVSGRRNETLTFLEPLSGDQARELVEALLPEQDAALASELAKRTGGNPLFVEEMVRRVQEEGSADVTELPETVQAVLAARLDSLAPFERRILQHAAVVGQSFWQDALSKVAIAEGCDLEETLATLEEKDILVPEAGARRAGDPELAFKHVLIRDVAYGMLPKAVRARKHLEVGAFLEERAGDRAEEVVTLLAEHYARAATLGRETSLPTGELEKIDSKALRFLEAAGDAASGVYSNQEAFAHYQSARDLDGTLPGDVRARIAEKQGDAALRLGRVDAALELWRDCLEFHRGEEDLERVAALCRKIGAALVHKGERQAAIEHLQRGINLLKDGPPNRELVRLYEEAALLYINTGDNMLAIYAAEKALRLAERLGETRAASRAHGIFGSVFGRIGDTSKARENLERSVELARGSDKEETIRALIALGQQLEVSQADYAGAQEAYGEALELAVQVGDVPAQIEIYAGLAQLAVYRADWPEVSRFTAASRDLAEREGLVGRLSLPLTLEALLHWREGDWDEAENLYERAHELAAQAGWSEIAFSALFGRALVLRDRRDYTEAVSVLGEALDVCERAGLVGRSIQAMSLRGVVLHLDNRSEQARESAQEALALAERLNDAVGRAAALEADGVTAESPDAALRLREAADAWTELGRPLEAARCELLLGRALAEHKPQEALAAVDTAAAAFEQLGVPHLADRARSVL
jgi:class 3 adenylate cyclase/tetratricopeptide (TPR) repeat protein